MLTRESGRTRDASKAPAIGGGLASFQSWSGSMVGLKKTSIRKNAVYPRDVEGGVEASGAARKDLFEGKQGDFV